MTFRQGPGALPSPLHSPLLAVLTPFVLTAPASAATAKYSDNFNGDGHADLSVGAAGENNGDGAVWTLRGATTGLSTKNAVAYGPSSLGVSTSGAPRLGAGMLP